MWYLHFFLLEHLFCKEPSNTVNWLLKAHHYTCSWFKRKSKLNALFHLSFGACNACVSNICRTIMCKHQYITTVARILPHLSSMVILLTEIQENKKEVKKEELEHNKGKREHTARCRSRNFSWNNELPIFCINKMWRSINISPFALHTILETQAHLKSIFQSPWTIEPSSWDFD